MATTNDIDRIIELFEKTGVSAYEVAQNIDVTEAGIGKILNRKVKRPRKDTLNKILNYFDSNAKQDSTSPDASNIIIPNKELNTSPYLSEKGVPYYDVDFVGGFDLVFNSNTINPSFYINYAPYNNADAWVNVTGKSMSPFISHGDIAAFKKLNRWKEFIPFGEIYAVITDEFRTIKIVSAGKDENHLTLIPYNKSREFVEQQISKDLIHNMYKVLGSIKKFF